MMLPQILRTARTVLREHRIADAEDVYAFAKDELWARYLPVPQPYTREHADQFLATQACLDGRSHISWAIEHENHVIGGINIRFDQEHRSGPSPFTLQLGFSIARAHWRKGLASEVVSAVVDAAFRNIAPLARVRAMADARNAASMRVMEKVGMTREKVLGANRVVRGECIDEVWFELTRDTWADVDR